MAFREGSLEVKGTILRYSVEGTGVNPVLVVGSAVYYPRTFSRRLSEVFTLAFADLRHFALKSRAEHTLDRLTFDMYVSDIERIRAALGFEQFVIVGHSHHGNLALEYAKRYPEKVSRVVIIGSPPVNVERTIEASAEYWESGASEARKAALQRNRDAIDPDLLAKLAPSAAFITEYVADGPKYWYDAHYDASWLWENVPVNMEIIRLFRGLFAAAADYELSWDAERLKAPVLVIMGRHDYAVPHLLWKDVLPKLKNVTYHLFEQSGHTPQLEEQELFDRIFIEWVQRK